MTGLSVENLTFGYLEEPVVKRVTLSVPPGSFFGLLGPNGSGKTTLFKCISGLMKPWEGTVRYGSEDLWAIPRRKAALKAAFIPQVHSLSFPYTVAEYVLMGRYPHRGRLMPFSRADYRIVEETLDLLDIAHVRARQIQQLSGGEMQRVFLACGLAQKPEVLLMDEPTTHLDLGHQIRLLDLVRELSGSSGLTVLVTLHDLNLASLYCTSMALMNLGLIHVQGEPEQVLTRETIEYVYRTSVHVDKDPVTMKPHIFFKPLR